MNNIVDVDLNKQFRIEKCFDITKFFIYMKKNILKLKNFIRTCHNVFFIKFMIYRKHQFKINFAILLLFNYVSNSKWIWFKYRLNFNVATKSFNTWTEFCQFLKKHVNFIKFRIVNVKTKLHAIKQRANQTMFQLITYFETLKNQWTFLLSNSMKTNYLIQSFQEYIRKKLCWQNVDMTNRKIVKKTIFNIKILKKNLFIFAKIATKIRKIKISKNEIMTKLIFSKIVLTQSRIQIKNFRTKKNEKSKKQTKFDKNNLLQLSKKNIIKIFVQNQKKNFFFKIVENFSHFNDSKWKKN